MTDVVDFPLVAGKNTVPRDASREIWFCEKWISDKSTFIQPFTTT